MLSSSGSRAAGEVSKWLRQDEWQLLVTARPNVLLEGAPEATDAIVGEALDCLPKPQATWTGVPPCGDSPATLVVRSISEIDRDEQRALLSWLEAVGDHVQVISTTLKPLYPLVGRGAFLSNLYYRLNVLLVEVPGASQTAH
jgi:hypothetical protein